MPDKSKEDALVRILKEELIRATGCTEPVAIAYCAATLREVLGAVPERLRAELSGNILKNAKSVVVPNTGGLKGIKAALAAGIIAGDAGQGLQLLSEADPAKIPQIKDYAQNIPIDVILSESGRLLDIKVSGRAGEDEAAVRIADAHDRIVRIEKNGEILQEEALAAEASEEEAEDAWLDLRTIWDFATETDIAPLKEILDDQIRCNQAIAEEGLKNDWGANIGSTLLAAENNGIKTEAKAYAAAGSDARMGGCEMPVVIIAGSGNQGLGSSLPVLRYAKYLEAGPEKTYRALILSNLVTHYQKLGIGRLSAYCGAVSAGVAAGAGIAYLHGGGYEAVAQTIINAIAILSGTICDGAKPSCAAKIAAAVDAGIWGYEMYRNQQNFESGDGIIGEDVDATIRSVGRLASEGMLETDRTILDIMS